MILSQQSHLLRQYDADIDELKHLLMSMGDLVLGQIDDAGRAFKTNDIDLAQAVCDRDAAINALEVAVDRACTLLIAKHQPTASDLRLVLGISKMATDLERMGDQARNIAKVSRHELPEELIDKLAQAQLIEKTQKVVNLTLLAFKNLSETAAVNTLRADGDVDQSYRECFKILVRYLKEHPEHGEQAMICMNMIHSYERLGDHATNIAEHIIFILDGEDIRHLRVDALPENLQMLMPQVED